VEANSTGGHGSPRAVAPSDDDDSQPRAADLSSSRAGPGRFTWRCGRSQRKTYLSLVSCLQVKNYCGC
jgi:hypothetical protein